MSGACTRVPRAQQTEPFSSEEKIVDDRSQFHDSRSAQ